MNRLQIALFALLVTTWSVVGSANERSPLTLSAAFERATSAHPGLQAAKLELDIAGGRRDADALPPVMTVGLEVENFAGSGSVSGFDAAETTLGIARTLERGGKAKLRHAAGSQRVELADLEARVTRIELEAETERLFFAALSGQASEQKAIEAVTLAEQLLAIVNRRVDVGRSSEAERHTASIRLARARLELRQARLSASAARDRLAFQWGTDRADFDAVAGDLSRLPDLPDMQELRRRLETNPELQRLAGEAELVAIQRKLASAAAKTDVELSARIRYLSDPNDAAFVVGVAVPIGQSRRATPMARAARAKLTQLPLISEQRRRVLLGVVAGLHAEIERRRLALTAIRDEMLPRAVASLELYRNGYELGGYSLLELTEAQNMALGLGREFIEVAAELHAIRIELTRLTGGARAPGASS